MHEHPGPAEERPEVQGVALLPYPAEGDGEEDQLTTSNDRMVARLPSAPRIIPPGFHPPDKIQVLYYKLGDLMG